MSVYDELQPGEYVYFQEKPHMLYCRIVRIRTFADRPGYREYVLHIVDQWYNHDYFEPRSVFLFGRRLSVGRTGDLSGNVPWYFYTPREPTSRRWVAAEAGCRQAAILIVLLGCYALYVLVK